jgi:hypothetical protein
MQTVNNEFGFLEPPNVPEADILNLCADLNKQYPKVVSPHFLINLFMVSLLRKYFNCKQVSLAIFGIRPTSYNEKQFRNYCSEICTVIVLPFMFSLKVASFEWSFSNLKVMQTNKSTKLRIRLNGLTILVTEYEEPAKDDIKELASDSANAKGRKKNVLIRTRWVSWKHNTLKFSEN